MTLLCGCPSGIAAHRPGCKDPSSIQELIGRAATGREDDFSWQAPTEPYDDGVWEE